MLSSAIKNIIMKPMKTQTTFEMSTTRVGLNLISGLRLPTILSPHGESIFLFFRSFSILKEKVFLPQSTLFGNISVSNEKKLTH